MLRCLQALPPRCYTGEDTAAWLRDELLTLRLEGTAAADVAVAGERPSAAAQPLLTPHRPGLSYILTASPTARCRSELAAALRTPHAVD